MLLKRYNYPTPLHIAMVGAAAVISQTLLIREMLGLFRMTEATIGLLLSAWLFWTGTGGMVSGRLSRLGGLTNALILRLSVTIASLMLPVTVLLIRFGRGWLASPPGALPDFIPAVILSLGVTAVPGLLFGSAYNAASLSIGRGEDGIKGGIGRVYIAEAIGAAVGALAFSYFMAGRMTHISSAFLVAAFMIVSAGLPIPGRRLSALQAALAVLMFLGLAVSGTIDDASNMSVFGGYDRIITAPSRYGELVAAESGGAISYYSGGSRLFSYPEPERAEETVHLALLSHPCPRKVLLVGGSLGGVVEKVLRHGSLDTLHCVEIDEALNGLFERSLRMIDGEESGETPDPGSLVVRIFGDARRYMTETVERYDVVIVAPPSPVNLQWNRYYTLEFFEIASRLLRGGGVLSISHPSSEDYIGYHLAMTLACVKKTMERVFDNVTVLPGGTAHFISSGVPAIPDSIMKRVENRRIRGSYISNAYLPDRLSHERIETLAVLLGEEHRAEINRDSYPVLTFYELILESRKRDRIVSDFFGSISRLHGSTLPIAVFLCAIALLLAGRRGGTGMKGVFLAGFSAFVTQMMLIFRFQSAGGVIYHAIIMISALFMAGASTGAVLLPRVSGRQPVSRRSLHLWIACSVILFLAATTLRSPLRDAIGEKSTVYYLFSFVNGLLTGAYYRHSVMKISGTDLERTPAAYYSADLMGACAGGLLAGTVILPVSGIYWTGGMVMLINIAAAMLLRKGGAR